MRLLRRHLWSAFLAVVFSHTPLGQVAGVGDEIVDGLGLLRRRVLLVVSRRLACGFYHLALCGPGLLPRAVRFHHPRPDREKG